MEIFFSISISVSILMMNMLVVVQIGDPQLEVDLQLKDNVFAREKKIYYLKKHPLKNRRNITLDDAVQNLIPRSKTII